MAIEKIVVKTAQIKTNAKLHSMPTSFAFVSHSEWEIHFIP